MERIASFFYSVPLSFHRVQHSLGSYIPIPTLFHHWTQDTRSGPLHSIAICRRTGEGNPIPFRLVQTGGQSGRQYLLQCIRTPLPSLDAQNTTHTQSSCDPSFVLPFRATTSQPPKMPCLYPFIGIRIDPPPVKMKWRPKSPRPRR